MESIQRNATPKVLNLAASAAGDKKRNSNTTPKSINKESPSPNSTFFDNPFAPQVIDIPDRKRRFDFRASPSGHHTSQMGKAS